MQRQISLPVEVRINRHVEERRVVVDNNSPHIPLVSNSPVYSKILASGTFTS